MFRLRPIALGVLALMALVRPSLIAAAADCATAVVPSSLELGPSSGTIELEVQGPAGCTWTASTSDRWIGIVGSASGAGGGLLQIAYEQLPAAVPTRVGTVVAGGQTFRLTQRSEVPAVTESLVLFGDVTFNSRDRLRVYKSVSAGDRYTLAVTGSKTQPTTDTGRVIGFGNSGSNQCIVPGLNEGYARVSAGLNHSIALTNADGRGSEGAVVCWGNNTLGKASPPANLGLCKGIAAGSSFSVALTTAGTIRCWGDNTKGQCQPNIDVPAGYHIIRIAAGANHGMALLSEAIDRPLNGLVRVWGDNSLRQISGNPNPSGVKEIAAGWDHCVALKEDGTVLVWGNCVGTPICSPPESLVATHIDAFANYTLAQVGESRLVAWGISAPAGPSAYQQAILDGVGIESISAGYDHIAILTKLGTLMFTGSSRYFQDGSPIQLDRIDGIACGRYTLGAWNDVGRFEIACTSDAPTTTGLCSPPPELERVHSLAFGRDHVLAVERNTRKVVAWGSNQYGQASPGSALGPARAIAAGQFHSVSLDESSQPRVQCWGSNVEGQCNLPEFSATPIRIAAGGFQTMVIAETAGGVRSVHGSGRWSINSNDTAPLVYVPPQLVGQSPDSEFHPLEIACGSLFTMALIRGGGPSVPDCTQQRVVIWGTPGPITSVSESQTCSTNALAAGSQHALILGNNARIRGFGSDIVHQVSGPETLAQVPAVAAGDNRSLIYVDTALPLPNDIDGDGCTNGADLGILLSVWGTDGIIPDTDPQQTADLNGDGVVNGADLGLLLEDWYGNIDCGG